MKNMLETLKKIKKRLTFMTMASVLIITGCQKEQEEHQKNTERFISHGIELSIENAEENVVIKPEILDIVKDFMPEIEKESIDEEVISFYESIDLSSYKGNSLVDALKFVGLDSSVEFRTELAHYVGFENYDMSAYQNMAILNFFRKSANINKDLQEKQNDTKKEAQLETTIQNSEPNSTLGQEENISNNNSEEHEDDKKHEHNNSGSTNPSKPSEPSTDNQEPPKDDNEQTKPNPEEPVNPNPSNPSDPTEKPTEPDKPTDPSEKPTEPDKPTDPSEKPDPEDPECVHEFEYKTIYEPNYDETHKEIKTSTCKKCGEYKKEAPQTKGCSYDILIGVDDQHENWECICKDKKTLDHNLSTRINEEGAKVTFCTNPGCTYEKEEEREHTDHDYTILDHTDDKNEYWKCNFPNCTETTTIGHVLDKGVVQNDGTVLYSCLNEGCDYSYTPEHIHVSDFDTVFANEEDVCTRTTETCSECGEILSVVENSHPSFSVIKEGIFDVMYGCDMPGCPYIFTEPKNRESVSANSLEENLEEENGRSRTLTLDEEE